MTPSAAVYLSSSDFLSQSEGIRSLPSFVVAAAILSMSLVIVPSSPTRAFSWFPRSSAVNSPFSPFTATSSLSVSSFFKVFASATILFAAATLLFFSNCVLSVLYFVARPSISDLISSAVDWLYTVSAAASPIFVLWLTPVFSSVPLASATLFLMALISFSISVIVDL